MPFGESFVEQQASVGFSNPYKFTGHELDKQTGLYYAKARFYSPKRSIFLSVDPLANYNPVFETEHYGDGQHNGGIFNDKNLNTYGYCYGNPVVLVDPNGKQSYFLDEIGPANITAAAVNSVRAAVSNLAISAVNLFRDNPIPGRYVVNHEGSLVLVLDHPRGSSSDQAIDAALDVATIGLAAVGGTQGSLMTQGGKPAAINAVENAKDLKNIRQSAVRNAWKQEKALVESGAEGTRNWTKAELKELKAKGKVKGYEGHHINNVKHHPEHAGNPNNIEFLNKKEHLQRHNGNYKNKTTGDMKNRSIKEE